MAERLLHLTTLTRQMRIAPTWLCRIFAISLERNSNAALSLVSHDLMRIVLKAMKLTNYVGVIASNSVEQ